MGCNVYIHTELHNEMIRRGHDPGEYVNSVVEKALKRERYKVKKEEAGGAKG